MPVPDFKHTVRSLIGRAPDTSLSPPFNVTSLTTANAVLCGLADSKADGIIQISTGGGAFASGTSLKIRRLGAISIAEHVHRVADRYPIYVALHTDHCLKDKLEKFVIPLVEETEKRRAAGQPNLFTGHMFDGQQFVRCRRISTFPRSCSNASPKTISSGNRDGRSRRRGG